MPRKGRLRKAKVKKEPEPSASTSSNNCPAGVNPEYWTRLLESDQSFGEVIDLIPIDVWGFDEEIREKLRERRHDIVNKLLTPGQRKHFAKRDKHKLSQGDPSQLHTVREVWDWMAAEGLARNMPIRPPPNPLKNESNLIPLNTESSPANGVSVSNGSTDGSVGVKGKKQKNKKKRKPTKDKTDSDDEEVEKKPKIDADSSSVIKPSSSILRKPEAMAALQKRLTELRSKRVGDLSAMEYEKKKREKRRLSKFNLKQKKKAEKNSETPKQIPKEESESKVKKETDQKPVNGVKPPQIRNSEGKLVFTKFDFALPPAVKLAAKDGEKKRKPKSRSSKLNPSLQGRDYKRLLEKVEKREENLAQLEATDKAKADKLREKIKWDAAIQRAQGVKIKDDPEQLKKSLKRKDKKKDHSKKKWGQRESNVAQRQHEKQEKRSTNLQKRKDQKKKTSIAKAKKRGRL